MSSTRYSPIAPITLLEQMHEREIINTDYILGNYLLLLAHDVLEHKDRYGNLVDSIRRYYHEADDTFIIMDNSLVELGAAMPAEKVIEAAQVVEANCIMTPDALGGFEATKALVAEQHSELLTSGFSLMKVPQGEGYVELIECVGCLDEVLSTSEHKSYWGIPRWIASNIGSRKTLVYYIDEYFTSPIRNVHLLGMSNDFGDDMASLALRNVMGIDSANPMVAGINEASFTDGPSHHFPRGDYWTHTKLRPLSLKNVGFMHRRAARSG